MSFKEENENQTRYTNLVLEGGGALGVAICGALEELHVRGFLAGIKNFAGSSAGSIIAGAMACGASFNFILDELTKADFGSFLDYGNKLYAAYNMYYYNGICPGDVFENWYGGVIEKLTGDANITLKSIHKKYGGRLVITGTSLNTRTVKYFDYRNTPDIPLKKLVRISTSIPGVFIPVEYAGDKWVDGGVLDNYPIRAFHRNTHNNDKINPKTLGLMLLTASETAAYPPVIGIKSYVESLLGIYMSQTQKMYLDPQDWARTVKIPCGNVSGFNFYIDEKTKEGLLDCGRKAVRDHFGTRSLITQGWYYLRSGANTGYDSNDETEDEIDNIDDNKNNNNDKNNDNNKNNNNNNNNKNIIIDSD